MPPTATMASDGVEKIDENSAIDLTGMSNDSSIIEVWDGRTLANNNKGSILDTSNEGNVAKKENIIRKSNPKEGTSLFSVATSSTMKPPPLTCRKAEHRLMNER